MVRVLVTGMSGTGKSSALDELDGSKPLAEIVDALIAIGRETI